MRALFVILVTLYFSASHSAPSNKVCSRLGPITNCSVGVLEELHVAGKADLEGTTVIGHTHVSGMLYADHARLTTLHVAGLATIEKSQISQNSKFSGLLHACQSSFKGDLTIASDRVHLSKVDAMDIAIHPGGAQQIMCVGNESLIRGDVNFVSGHGLIAMDSGSKILGKVIGGEINNRYFKLYCEGDESC